MTDQTAPGPDAFLETAHALAEAAGLVARRYFRTPLDVDIKADNSPVTRADREAEAAMREILAEDWPDHGILGEEHGGDRTDAEYLWVLDPIDGTRAFICGVPVFGILIALAHKGVPILGMIDQPILGERWVGAAGRGTTVNGEPVSTRKNVPLDQARMFSTSPDMFAGPERTAAHARLREKVYTTRYGTDCYGAGLVAMGHGDLMCEGTMQPYDYAALVPVIEGAGGVMSDWAGKPLTLTSDGYTLAAGDAGLHEAALAALSWR